MSIHDSAYEGSLTLSQLRKHCSTHSSSSLNTIGGKINLTPLCAACLGGHLDVVKHFLTCGADPNIPSTNARTPLFFITDSQSTASPATRCAIIRELISGKHGLKADKDKPCDKDQNTPLMNAIIHLQDKVVIQELVDIGASPTIQHYPTQKNAEELGEEFGLAGSLVPKAERDLAWAKIIDLVVTFVVMVIAYMNNNTVNGVVDGIVKHYNISAKGMDGPKVTWLQSSQSLIYCLRRTLQDLQDEVESESDIDEVQDFLNSEVQQRNFGKFFSQNDPFLTNLAENANSLRNDATTDLGKPENIKRLTRLSLYHPVIYCDDSTSMTQENRYEYQIQLVTRIARLMTMIVPDDMAEVDLRFINNGLQLSMTAGEIQQVMRRIKASRGTEIGANLRNKILKPLVYDIIDGINLVPFERPLLVFILTDGHPAPEGQNVLRDEIISCKRKLEAKGYDPTSVIFCINQVGTSRSAKQFIDSLRNEKEIEEVTYCTVGQLDDKYEELKENERALELWLLDLLTKGIMHRFVPKPLLNSS